MSVHNGRERERENEMKRFLLSRSGDIYEERNEYPIRLRNLISRMQEKEQHALEAVSGKTFAGESPCDLHFGCNEDRAWYRYLSKKKKKQRFISLGEDFSRESKG